MTSSLRLLWLSRSLVNLGDCLLIKSFACLCPGVLSHHCRCCFSIRSLTEILIRLLDNPQKGSGPIKASFEPSLARASALSLPRNPACPGTQASVSLFRPPTSVRAVRQSHTSFEIIWHEESAFKAAWLSEYMATLLPTSPCLKISLAQSCNATNSA
uniref:Putative secreted protein n=1 Tax=Panstrongylus lignarius TaxID=156445 RepID=A0A224XMT1_9HEMI